MTNMERSSRERERELDLEKAAQLLKQAGSLDPISFPIKLEEKFPIKLEEKSRKTQLEGAISYALLRESNGMIVINLVTLLQLPGGQRAPLLQNKITIAKPDETSQVTVYLKYLHPGSKEWTVAQHDSTNADFVNARIKFVLDALQAT